MRLNLMPFGTALISVAFLTIAGSPGPARKRLLKWGAVPSLICPSLICPSLICPFAAAGARYFTRDIATVAVLALISHVA